jgi:hypothetical protein
MQAAVSFHQARWSGRGLCRGRDVANGGVVLRLFFRLRSALSYAQGHNTTGKNRRSQIHTISSFYSATSLFQWPKSKAGDFLREPPADFLLAFELFLFG